MTLQEEKFVNAYFLNNGNATKAAEIAGYSDPNADGSKIKNQPNVAAAIKERLDEFAMPANEVLARLADMARATLDDFIDLGNYNPDYPQALQGKWSLDLHKAKRGGKMQLLKSIKSGEFGPEITLHDAQAALTTLARHHKLLTEKVEHDFTKLSDAEIVRLATGVIDRDGAAGVDTSGGD